MGRPPKSKSSPSKSPKKSQSPVKKLKQKRSKKEKDPNAPKRAQSSYMYWLADNRKRIQKSLGDNSVTAVARRAGEEWKTVTATEKAKYEKISATDKKRYEKEKAAYEKKK